MLIEFSTFDTYGFCPKRRSKSNVNFRCKKKETGTLFEANSWCRGLCMLHVICITWSEILRFLTSYHTSHQTSTVCLVMFIGIHETSNVIFHHFSLKSIINSLNIWYCFYVEKASHPPMYTHTHTHNKCQKIDKKNVILRMMHLQRTAHFYCEIYLMLW